MKKRFLVALLAMLVVTVGAFSEKITILHLNDTHGHAWPYFSYPMPNIGGFAAIATKVKEIKKENPNTLFLHAGDINTGMPESDLLNAKPDIEALNMMGLNAVAIGNHEFDHTRDVLKKQMKWADFPFLSCNIFKKGDILPYFQPYTTMKVGNLKVAVIGVTTQSTEEIGNPKHVGDLDFRDPIQYVKRYKALLERTYNPDLIIVLSHLGYFTDKREKYAGSRQLAQAVSGIVIVDGHTHTELDKPVEVNGSIIVQASSWGKFLGRLDLDIENKKIVSYNGKLIKINFKKREKYYVEKDGKKIKKYKYYPIGDVIPEDKAVKDMLDKYKAEAGKGLNKPIGETKILLSHGTAETKDNLLAEIITDSIKDFTKADIALQNGGGIRADINPGKISYRDVLTVLPFGNTVFKMNMTGKEVMAVLNYAAGLPETIGAHLHTAGLTWTNNKGKVENVKVNGEALELNKMYSVAANDYMANGGDGYKTLTVGQNRMDTGYVLADLVADYIKKIKLIDGDNYKLEVRNTIIK
ncbi:5'-nucleotidase C-terminal domain-containing protein [Haliovirga abyssi]|uniref:Bifunctional UDP-sugar hydrolase/5'-nucleotidase n=1 Tax=Haliovirga abyssi TaxID=2996794 RepID=A0AAU9DLG8_9FUSO|nr:5'-nucleotidase C-terminal domain-containing protein [Haliovirga abyssi]BDU50802.1 bifunctional UDP-sugar hydrolase/5'-nucleotidase [Haliovirga abyssi]